MWVIFIFNIKIIFKEMNFIGKNGEPFPLSVDIEGCEEPPCDVVKGTTAIMYVHFLGSKFTVLKVIKSTLN